MNAAQIVADAVMQSAEHAPAALRADLFEALATCTQHLDANISSTAAGAAAAIREAEASQLLLRQIINPK